MAWASGTSGPYGKHACVRAALTRRRVRRVTEALSSSGTAPTRPPPGEQLHVACRARRSLAMLLLGVATATATSNATANTPRMLVQFGPSRTATTLQFQSICAAAVLLSRRGDQPPEDQVTSTRVPGASSNMCKVYGYRCGPRRVSWAGGGGACGVVGQPSLGTRRALPGLCRAPQPSAVINV